MLPILQWQPSFCIEIACSSHLDPISIPTLDFAAVGESHDVGGDAG